MSIESLKAIGFGGEPGVHFWGRDKSGGDKRADQRVAGEEARRRVQDALKSGQQLSRKDLQQIADGLNLGPQFGHQLSQEMQSGHLRVNGERIIVTRGRRNILGFRRRF